MPGLFKYELKILNLVCDTYLASYDPDTWKEKLGTLLTNTQNINFSSSLNSIKDKYGIGIAVVSYFITALNYRKETQELNTFLFLNRTIEESAPTLDISTKLTLEIISENAIFGLMHHGLQLTIGPDLKDSLIL